MKLTCTCVHCGKESEVQIPKITDLIRQESGCDEPLKPGHRRYWVNCTNPACGWQSVVQAKNLVEALEVGCIKHNETRDNHDTFQKGVYGEEGILHVVRGYTGEDDTPK